MLKSLGIVQACFHVPRFRANAMRRFGGRPLLEWVVRRVTDSIRLGGVIVVACGSDDCDCISASVPSDVPVFRARCGDALGRLCQALEAYPSEGVVRVHGGDLFIDPTLIDRLVTAAEADSTYDYVAYRSRDGRPAAFSPVSVYSEWFRSSALRKANQLARERGDREDVTGYLRSHPEKFHLGWIPAPAEIDREDVRLTVDIEEDWDHALLLFEALGAERFDWQRITSLLDHQPAMRRRMAALNRAYTHA
jgi:spore coat polysaccharide biosynthesis protein SpsF (cytidylyltransferase family)